MTKVAITGGAGGVGSSLAINPLLRPELYRRHVALDSRRGGDRAGGAQGRRQRARRG